VENSFSEFRADEHVVWCPQKGPQEALVNCPITLIGYGGARGGGKTDGVLGKFAIKQEQMGADFNAIFFRKELPQADDLIERAKQIYLPLKAHWQDQKKQFTFLSGGRLRFRPLGNDADAEKYQGQNLSDCAIEEAGNYADPSPIWKLFGALRGKGGGQIILTFNPGGIGHHWLKELFIKPAPKGMKVLTKVLPNGGSFDYIYIPSRVTDNQILLARDPEYINRLHMVGSPELVRAWLEGDFEIHEGSYFPEFSSKHIVTPFNVPKHWPRYLGFDWGYRSPFAAVWGAVSSGRNDRGDEVPYPKGAIIIYREMSAKGVDNVEQANRIASVSMGENPISVADPSIFSHEGGPSINDQFNSIFAKYKHPTFRPADNDRISGWSQIRQRLVANPPLLYIFATCPYLLETLPSMSIDKRNPEDLDSSGNDHACLAGDTLVQSDIGIKPIRELCGDSLNLGGNFPVWVKSHDGHFYKAWGRKTRKNATVIKLTFDDNSQVVCTPDHRFMLHDGTFKMASLLTPKDLIQCGIYEGDSNQSNVSGVQRSKILPLWQLLLAAKEKYPRLQPITQKGLGVLQWLNSQRYAHSSYRSKQGKQSDREFSTAQSCTASCRTHDAGTTTTGSNQHCSVGSSSSKVVAQITGGEAMALNSCQGNFSLNATRKKSVFVLRKGLPDEKKYELEISILPSELQDVSTTKKVIDISWHEPNQDVYCLNVPETSTFVLGNGVISHNCDALRYLCKARLIDAKWEQTPDVVGKGIVKLQSYIARVRARNKRPTI